MTEEAPTEREQAIERLRAAAEAATPGPWGWRGYVGGSIELRTLHSGGKRIISTHRLTPCIVSDGDCSLWVTTDACDPCRAEAGKTQDPFIDYDGCERPFDNVDTVWLWDRHHIRPANTWAVREQSYRDDVASVDHPDATYIAAVDPTTVLSLLDEIDRLRALSAAALPAPGEAGDDGAYEHVATMYHAAVEDRDLLRMLCEQVASMAHTSPMAAAFIVAALREADQRDPDRPADLSSAPGEAGEVERLRALVTEQEEQLASIADGCLNATREELVARITAVGPERWKAGVWLSEHTAPLHRVIRELRDECQGYAARLAALSSAPGEREAGEGAEHPPSLTDTFRWADGGEVEDFAWMSSDHAFDEWDGEEPRAYLQETWQRTGVRVRWAMPDLYDCDYEDAEPCDEDAVAWQREGETWMAACPKHRRIPAPVAPEAEERPKCPSCGWPSDHGRCSDCINGYPARPLPTPEAPAEPSGERRECVDTPPWPCTQEIDPCPECPWPTPAPKGGEGTER